MITTMNIENFNAGLYYGTMADIKSTVLTLKSNYPKISQWFQAKVEPGIIKGDRSIILAKSGENLAGFTILKNASEEKKICTFYVYPKFRGCGVANDLFQESFRVLGTTKPLMTIPENRFKQFSKYVDEFGFELANRDYVYQNDTKELIFNGSL